MSLLADIAAGRLPDATVPSLRFEGFGGESYAREPIVALIARYPERVDDALSVEGQTAACLAGLDDGAAAGFADLHDGVVVRLWRLGGAVAEVVPRPRVAVAADHDLSQLRHAVLFDPADHRELTDPAAVETASHAAAALDFGLAEPPLRVRVFVRRAVTAGPATAALFGLAVLANGTPRQPLAFNVAALCLPGSAPRLVIDHAGLAAAQAAAWTPHL